MDQLSEVVKYILYRCRENNTPLTQIMANFIAQTVLNPRTQKFYLQDKLSESEMRELKEAAIKKVFSKDSLTMRVTDLQITYDTQFLQTELAKQAQTRQQAIDSGQHIDDVVCFEVKNAKDFQGLTQLYKKIFNFLLYKNQEITDPEKYQQFQFKVQKQVAAALQSVIPRAALGPFVTLNSSEKVTQLVELANLVVGIRLFNEQIGKGGAGLRTIEQLLSFEGRSVRDASYKQLEQITQLCQSYTAVFKVENKGKIELQPNQFKRLKNQLTFVRQYKSFLINLVEQIEATENVFETNQINYEKQITDLKSLLGTKSSAPKQQVYPRFAILAQAYTSIYEERKSAEEKIRLYKILKEYRKTFPLSLSNRIVVRAHEQLSLLPAERTQQIIEDPHSGVEMFLPSTSPDFMQKTCDYLGFCIYTLVKKNGLLMPGQPDLGVFKYKDRNCVFSSVQAINQFIKEPEFYIQSVIDICRKNPQLIHFLRLQEAFKNVKLSLVSHAVEGGIKNKLMLDKALETPTHFIEKNIDPNYCWNQWQLRKKAIQMANIRKTQTRGDQTLLSNFRVDSDTQTYLKKDAETNTSANVGTQFKVQKQSKAV